MSGAVTAPTAQPIDAILDAFWDLFDWLAVRIPATPGLNMANDPSVIAFNICHFESMARYFKRSLPLPLPALRAVLEQSTAPRYIRSATYNCHDGRGRHCMIFRLGGEVA